jgi:hypothetical protein
VTRKNLLRDSIKYGYVTVSRKLRRTHVGLILEDMAKQGWVNLKEVGSIFADTMAAFSPETLDQSISPFFTDKVKNKFLVPYIQKPGKEIFSGPMLQDGTTEAIPQDELQQVWAQSGGNVANFILKLYDVYKTNASEADPAAHQKEFVGRTLSRIESLFQVQHELVGKTGEVKDAFDPHSLKAHRMMDARTDEDIPPEFFEYSAFDTNSAHSMLSEIAYHAAFGRNGVGLQSDLTSLQINLKPDHDRYQEIMKLPANKRKDAAAAEGWNLTEIKRAYENYKAVPKCVPRSQ